jgi:hypothetical protein
MILSDVFRTSREVGRSKLSHAEGKDSFGYWIDVPNNWESYRTSDEMVAFLGIHNTHIYQFPEIAADLGALSDDERDWVKRYVATYERVARLLTTTGRRVDLRCDIAETLTDWRIIQKFVDLPAKILDFGAGCLRQGTSAYLRHPDNIYTAVDASLAAYTIQNMVLSLMNAEREEAVAHDFLDYEIVALPFPDIASAPPGGRFHVPTWLMEQARLPERFYDVVIAAHVHNELSGPDFLRLVGAVEKNLADEGIFYVRSELHIGYAKDFYDAIDFHAIPIIEELKRRGLVPIWGAHTGAFLTTVFAREGSARHRRAQASEAPEDAFWRHGNAYDLCSAAGADYLARCGRGLVEAPGKIALIGRGNHLYERFLAPLEAAAPEAMVVDQADLTGEAREETLRKIAAFDPDNIAIGSPHMPSLEKMVLEALGNPTIGLRRHYWYPVVLLRRAGDIGIDPLFADPIFGPADVGKAGRSR